NPSDSAVTVIVNTANGTATTTDSDYTPLVNQTVTFLAGNTSQTVTVNVTGDVKVEGNETFTVNLSSPVGATIASGTGTGSITNDDFATLSIGNITLAEGNS